MSPESKIQLIMMGSTYSLMHKIFEDSKEPLFGHADRILQLKPFSITQIQAILKLHGHGDEPNPLFYYFLLTGGIPNYVELLLTEKIFHAKKIFDFVFSENSPFLHESKNVLIEELGKEYGIYFSILELIAGRKTSRSAIESVLQKDIGGHLSTLKPIMEYLRKSAQFSQSPKQEQ